MCIYLKCKNATRARNVLPVCVKKLLVQVIMADILTNNYS